MDAHPLHCPHDVRREVMRMHWRNLTFVHWPFEPAEVQATLPDGLTVDTFDGAAWVGLVPFEMTVELPGGIPIPREGRFPETNVRTYVIGPDGTPGVWFASLEAGRFAASAVARVTYGLPYFRADMSITNAGPVWAYRSTRRWPDGSSLRANGPHHESAVQVGAAIDEQSDRDRFLSARWGLYSTFRNRLLYAPIWHEPWPLRHGQLLHLDDELMGAGGYRVPDTEPLVHWTSGVEVRIGLPRRAD